MDNKDLIGMIVAILAGSFAIMGSILNWDLFFANKNSFINTALGRNGARIFYICLGLFLYYIAYKIEFPE